MPIQDADIPLGFEEVVEDIPEGFKEVGTWDAVKRVVKAGARGLAQMVNPLPLVREAVAEETTRKLGRVTEAAKRGDILESLTALLEPTGTATGRMLGKGIAEAQIAEGRKAAVATDPLEIIGRSAAAAVPLVGPAAAQVGERIGTGIGRVMGGEAGEARDVVGGLEEAAEGGGGMAGLLLPMLMARMRGAAPAARVAGEAPPVAPRPAPAPAPPPPPPPLGGAVSRRGFIKGAGTAAVGAAVPGGKGIAGSVKAAIATPEEWWLKAYEVMPGPFNLEDAVKVIGKPPAGVKRIQRMVFDADDMESAIFNLVENSDAPPETTAKLLSHIIDQSYGETAGLGELRNALRAAVPKWTKAIADQNVGSIVDDWFKLDEAQGAAEYAAYLARGGKAESALGQPTSKPQAPAPAPGPAPASPATPPETPPQLPGAGAPPPPGAPPGGPPPPPPGGPPPPQIGGPPPPQPQAAPPPPPGPPPTPAVEPNVPLLGSEVTGSKARAMLESALESSLPGARPFERFRARQQKVLIDDYAERVVKSISAEGAGLSAEEAGSRLQSGLADAKEALHAKVGAEYKALDDTISAARAAPGRAARGRVATAPLKAVGQTLLKEIDRLQKIAPAQEFNRTRAILEQLNKAPAKVDFSTMQAYRSWLLGKVRQIGEEIPGRAEGMVKKITEHTDSAMESAAKEIGPDFLQKLRQTNANYRDYVETFNRSVAAKIADAPPEKAGKMILGASLEDVRRISKTVAPAKMQIIKARIFRNLLEDAIEGEIKPSLGERVVDLAAGRVDLAGRAPGMAGEKLKGAALRRSLEKIGEDKLSAIYNKQELQNMVQLAQTAERVGAQPRSLIGSFVNYHLLFQVGKGVGKLAGGDITALAEPIATYGALNIMSRIYARPGGGKVLNNFYRALAAANAGGRDAFKIPPASTTAELMFWAGQLARQTKAAGQDLKKEGAPPPEESGQQ